MREFRFSVEELATIRKERLANPSLRCRQKFDVLAMKSQGLTHEMIAQIVGISRRTVQRYLDEYLESGLAGVALVSVPPPRGALLQHQALLEDHFNDHPPATVAQAQADTERLTGVRRGLTQVRLFLKKCSVCAGAKPDRSPPKPIPPFKITSSARVWSRV